MLTQLIRDCRDFLAWWSFVGAVYAPVTIYQNRPTFAQLCFGVVMLTTLACYWAFYRRLRWAHGYLTRYDNPTKEKP